MLCAHIEKENKASSLSRPPAAKQMFNDSVACMVGPNLSRGVTSYYPTFRYHTTAPIFKGQAVQEEGSTLHNIPEE